MTVYTFIYLAAMWLFAILSWRMAKRSRESLRAAALLVIQYALGMAFGAHLLYFPIVRRTLTNPNLQQWYDRLGSVGHSGWDGVLDWFNSTGGLWGGPMPLLVATAALVLGWRTPLKQKKRLLDILAVSLAFAYALAKVACFSAGCCHGFAGEGLLFIRFDWVSDNPGILGQSLFPTQLLDVVILASIGTLLACWYRSGRQRGLLILWFVATFAVGRFLSELTRGDNVGGSLFGLSPVQVVLLLVLPICVFLLASPSRFDALLERRMKPAPAMESLDEASRIRIAKHQRNLLIVLVLCFSLTPLMVLLPIIAVPFFVRRMVRAVRRESPVDWSAAFNLYCYFGLGVLSLATFFVPNVLVGIGLVSLFVAGEIVMLNRLGPLEAPVDAAALEPHADSPTDRSATADRPDRPFDHPLPEPR